MPRFYWFFTFFLLKIDNLGHRAKGKKRGSTKKYKIITLALIVVIAFLAYQGYINIKAVAISSYDFAVEANGLGAYEGVRSSDGVALWNSTDASYVLNRASEIGGSIFVKGPLSCSSSVTLSVAGTTLYSDGSGELVFAGAHGILITTNNITLQGLTFTQTEIVDPVSQMTIQMSSSSSGCTIKNNIFNGGLFDIFIDHAKIGANTISYNTFKNVVMGITLRNSDNNLISDNRFEGVINFGISITDGSGSNKVFDNTMLNFGSSTGMGIGGDYLHNTTISRNNIDCSGTIGYGIDIEQSGAMQRPVGNTISDNIVKNAKFDGIIVFYCDDTIVSNNTVSSSGYNGIRIYSSTNTLCKNNLSFGNAFYGISVEISTNTTLSANSFVGAANILGPIGWP